jgi:predicted protein tyrosine phosphatase
MFEEINLLFICSRNQWRSPTAETIWQKQPGINARSAGTAASARHRLSADDIHWASVILVMEDKHKAQLMAEFGAEVRGKPVHVLDIPDEYRYMDPELVEQITEAVASILGLNGL